jgi:hypothetical protein
MDTSTLVGAALGFLIALVLVAILTVVFRWLWNTTMPDVFGVKSLTFWQDLKILILAGILFGGHRAVIDAVQEITQEPAAAAAVPAK